MGRFKDFACVRGGGHKGQKWARCAVLANALADTGRENQNHRGIN